jgi:hypothetical protein
MKTRLLRIASSDKVIELSQSNSRFEVALNETLNVQQIKGTLCSLCRFQMCSST